MAATFYNLKSESGLKKLNEYLLTRSYITGYQASKDDITVYAALPSVPSSEFVNVARWYKHIDALLRISGVSGVIVESSLVTEEAVSTLPVADTMATEAEDDDVGLYSEETEEEKKKEAMEWAASMKASGKKKESGKSSVVKSVQLEGLLWGAYLSSKFTAVDGPSRYRADFHEIKQIGRGNFSCVFKVLKRIDGGMYAVKRNTNKLQLETERRKALMEVQALASLGSHENIVGYYTSWLENEQLYIQMEICDHTLSVKKDFEFLAEGELLEALYQVGNALQFMHGKGIAHIDVKPDNIYVKNGVYKLGDFGCATLIDNSLPIEEGDVRYMPQEILNKNYDHLDKVDIFSLGVSIYELVLKLPLPQPGGGHVLNFKEGKLPLLTCHSLQFQNLLKAMIDPDPVKRPSARELVENPIFKRASKNN
ncbi:Mitosis inhibitor protein kinase wee1 [Trifolium repens]|nr:elongation factor 1-delta [Trifolium repens]WJX57286.1 Mitosis inhibitor protein kinase wee1 [Trifolium repens]